MRISSGKTLLFASSLFLIACSGLPPLDEKATTTQGRALNPTNKDRVGDFLHSSKFSDGSLIVAYHNQTRAALELAVESSAGSENFERHQVVGEGTIGYYNHIAMGNDDHFVVFTHNKTTHRFLAIKGKRSGASLTFEKPQVVDDGMHQTAQHIVGKWPSGAIDQNGVAHVFYYDQTAKTMNYANNHGGSWSSIEVQSDEDSGPSTRGDDIGLYSSMLLGDKGEIFVAFYNRSKGDAYLAVGTPSAEGPKWQFHPIYTAGDIGKWIKLARKGELLVAAFYDETLGDLVVMQQQEPTSYVFGKPIRIDKESHVGTDISMRVASSGAIHIAYLAISEAASAFDLKHAIVNNGEVTTQTIDKKGNVGFWNSIELNNEAPTFIYHLSSVFDSATATLRSEEVLIYSQ